MRSVLTVIAHLHPDLVVVHGACKSSPDETAAAWCFLHDMPDDPFPVMKDEYAQHGKRAPFVRNSRMVRAGGDYCVAFIAPCRKDDCSIEGMHGTHGATHCSALAEAAGIKTRRFHHGDRVPAHQAWREPVLKPWVPLSGMP